MRFWSSFYEPNARTACELHRMNICAEPQTEQEPTMRVLIADDDAVSRDLLGMILKDWGYECITAANGEEAFAILESDDSPQLAILDWEMPPMDGEAVCRAVRALPRERYTYLVLVTGRGRVDDIACGLEAGADDYLVKPYDPVELRARLAAGRRILELQSPLLETLNLCRFQATHDPLTGAWNHRAILEALERESARATRESSPLGLILMDLDHFKRINDGHGHLAGDEVLREACRRVHAAMRPYDLIGRYGGEEFLFVLPGCDLAETTRLAERLRERLAEEPVPCDGKAIPVSGSFGVAEWGSRKMSGVGQFIRSVDEALYRAKSAGRNRVEA